MREGGFATSATASLYEIVFSILTWDRMHRGQFDCLLYSLKTVDCSKGALAWSYGQKVVLDLMAIGEKGESNLWLNPRMLPILGK